MSHIGDDGDTKPTYKEIGDKPTLDEYNLVAVKLLGVHVDQSDKHILIRAAQLLDRVYFECNGKLE